MGEAAGTNTRFDDIDVTAKATAAGSGSARQVRVDVNINPARLSLTQADGKWTGQIDLMLLAFDRQDKVVGVAMPSRFSSDHSVNDARDLAKNLGVAFHVVPIAQALPWPSAISWTSTWRAPVTRLSRKTMPLPNARSASSRVRW